MSDLNVQMMTTEQKIAESARRAVFLLPPSVQHQGRELIQLESFQKLKALAVASPVMSAVSFTDESRYREMGFLAYESVQSIGMYWYKASKAQSGAQLDEAAKHFWNGVITGGLIGISDGDMEGRIARLIELASIRATAVWQELREELWGEYWIAEKLSVALNNLKEAKAESQPLEKAQQKNPEVKPNRSSEYFAELVGFDRLAKALVNKPKIIRARRAKQELPMHFFKQRSLKIVRKQN